MIQKALVTGAAGFIGSHLCERLIEIGWKVTGVDNFNTFYSPSIKKKNISKVLNNPNFSFIKADVCNYNLIDNILSTGFDLVVHLAAMAGVRPSMEKPILYQKVNVGGTLTVLESCRKYEVSHVVFASSSSVYGNTTKAPFRENDLAIVPISVYAATKRAGEILCQSYSVAYRLPITVLRLFTAYGPRQRPDLAIHKFSTSLLQGKPISIFGDGSTERDYTYIDDIIDGIISSLEVPVGFRVFNLGSSKPTRLDSLIQMLEKILCCTAKLEYKPLPNGDVQRTCADLNRSWTNLGYEPKYTLEEGLQEFAKWLKK